MKPRVGERLSCPGCETEVIVVRAPESDLDIACGGESLVPQGSKPAAGDATRHDGDGTLMGKRYAHEDSGLELLCTKAGTGSLAVGSEPLALRSPKTLPSSD